MRYQRRIHPSSHYSITVYASLTAEALWGWNRLHSSLFEMFVSLLGDGPRSRKKAYAIWHMFQSDKSQREMLSAVAEAALEKSSRTLERVKWLISVTNRFAPYRNAVVHVPVYFEHRPGKPAGIILDEAAARDVARIRLDLAGPRERFWNNMAGDLFCLGQFANGINSQLNDGVQPDGSSLQRPKLLSLRRMSAIDRLMSPPQPKPKRKPRRPSSQKKS
ncbi:hypothetical protein [Taklimakanibacter lacteus]|uniref:hypothetical protein n=1 Tax=Taklimakanibacter lacteus TaxID=2268456 RepID=UPI000E66727A